MSRHRFIKSLDINHELDDDALSDGGDDELTDEQLAQLHDGLEHVQAVLGEEGVSGLSDKVIKDALWEFYFDVEKTITWALEEQQKIIAARERKAPAPYAGKDLPEIPYTEDSNVEYYDPEQWQQRSEERSRVPLIVQAQQQSGFNGTLDVSESGTPRVLRKMLSKITELSERTELSPRLPSRQQLTSIKTPRPISSSTISSYGEVIERDPFKGPVDPNLIPVSPSGSALHRLSAYEPAPSLAASESRSSIGSPSEPVPSSDGIPEIPDFNSKSTKHTILPVPPPKKSKLSMLASSRASSVVSLTESSRSSGIALTGSVKTFPALRPSPQSSKPLSSAAPSEPGDNTEYYNQRSLTPSSTSSHVRRAIQTALNQEAGDRIETTNSSPQSVGSSDRSKTPTPSRPAAHVSKVPQTVHTFPEGQQPARPLSKLALLAQAKADASRAPKLPKSTTEYLTPIANGSSVTTAITTSYQSLYSLTDPSRAPIIPKQHVVPLSNTSMPPPSPDAKRSKLAMKIRKAGEKHHPEPEEVITPPVSPMFYSKSTRVRASPSAFASLLIDDLTTFEDKDEDREARRQARERRREERRIRETERPDKPSIQAGDALPGHKRRHKSPKAPPPPSPPTQQGFAFEGPSPDDIVVNARRGTSLGQKISSPSTPAHRRP